MRRFAYRDRRRQGGYRGHCRDGRRRRHQSALALVLVLRTRDPVRRSQRASVLPRMSRVARQTRDREGGSVLVQVPTRAGWERFTASRPSKSPGGPISLNKSLVGPQGAEALIYWTSFPDGDYADPCARSAGPVDWPIHCRSRGRSVDSARHQARHGAFGRHPGRAPREARGAHRSQERRLRPGVLLHLATPGTAVRSGERRTRATRSGFGSSPWTARASSSQPRQPGADGGSKRRSSRSSNRSASASQTDTDVKARAGPGLSAPALGAMSSGGPRSSCCASETDLKRAGSIIRFDMRAIESQGGTR